MSKRVERQARDLYNYYILEIGKQPKAVNSTKFAEFVAKKCGYSLKMLVAPMGNPLRGMILTKEKTTPKEASLRYCRCVNTALSFDFPLARTVPSTV